MTRLRLHTCVLLASLPNVHQWSERKGLGSALDFQIHDPVHSCMAGTDFPFPCLSSLLVDSSSELVLVLCEPMEESLVDRPCNLDMDPEWRGSPGTGGRVFEEVSGSFL